MHKLNIYQVLNFMYQIKINTALIAFYSNFNEVNHSYPTLFSDKHFVENEILLTQTKFRASPRGPRLWNNLLNTQQRVTEQKVSFKNQIKTTLPSLNESVQTLQKVPNCKFAFFF